MATTFIREKKDRDFTTINNTFIKDTSLSWKAKGLMTYLLSLPDDWAIHLSEVKNHATDGDASLRSAIKELIEHGYLKTNYKSKSKEKKEDGTWAEINYTIIEKPESPFSENPHTENPHTENPHTENPHTENPHTENRTLLNTNKQNTNLPNTDIPNTDTQNLYSSTEKKQKKKSKEPFRTSKEQILQICQENNFTGKNNSAIEMAEWFCESALFEDGSVVYKGNEVKNYIGLVSLLKSINANGKQFSKQTGSYQQKVFDKSNLENKDFWGE